MRRILAPLVALAGVAVVGFSAPAPAVIGGQAASQAYPFMAALRDGNDQFCGASLIAPDKALTAAHCVPDGNPQGLNLLFGRTRLSDSGGESIPLASITVHDRYAGDPGGGYDIALLTLESPSTATPIRIARTADLALFDPGDIVRVIGWGSSVFLVGPGSDDLQEVDVPIVSDSDCSDTYSEFDPQTMVCAGEASGFKDSCQGDSGGPLFAFDASGAPVQFGTVSYGLGCGFPGYYGVYGRVGDATLRDWIAARVPSIDQPLPAGTPVPVPTPVGTSPSTGPAPTPAPSTVTRLRFAQDLGTLRSARKRKRIRLRVQSTAAVRNVRATLTGNRGGKALARASARRIDGRTTLTLKLVKRAKLRSGPLRITLRATDARGRTVTVRGLAFLRR